VAIVVVDLFYKGAVQATLLLPLMIVTTVLFHHHIRVLVWTVEIMIIVLVVTLKPALVVGEPILP
jgi:hypothetical protein